MSEQTASTLGSNNLVVSITVVRDCDGRWTSRWPAQVVSYGLSAGVGRHDTRRQLVEAAESAGWRLYHRNGDSWVACRQVDVA